jgi:nitrate/TMAO reductase-like tetraheme cytochrome c subunit
MFLLVVVVGLGGMAGFAEYSMQPEFCQGCHIMQPYYKAWHESSHKGVPCVDCHFLPGLNNTLYGKFQASSQAVKYITNTYGSKPHAEIQDASCMRAKGTNGQTCHDTRTLEGKGKVNWPVQTERGGQVTIHFDHTPHLTLERRGKQLRCVSCHSQIVQGKHIVVTTDTCFLCHFKGLKHGRDDQTVGTCKGCHDPPSQPIHLATGEFNHATYTDRGVKCENCHADTVRGDGAVPRQVCWNCHNQTDQISRYGETNMLHKEHVTAHKVECSGCHVQIEHSLVAGAREEQIPGTRFATDSGTCGMCHEQLHAGPREMFRGTGGRGIPDMPSPMARARVNCIACHMQKKEQGTDAEVIGQTFVATQDRCDYCHGDKYKGVLNDWRKLIATNQDKAEAALLSVKKLQSTWKGGSEDAVKVARLLDDAEFNIKFVKDSHGVHNPTYATALLNVARDRCREAETIMTGKVTSLTP